MPVEINVNEPLLMRDAFLISDSLEIELPDIAQKCSRLGPISDPVGSTIRIRSRMDAECITVERDDCVLKYFEKDELESLTEAGISLKSARVFHIQYRKAPALLELLGEIVSFDTLWFDNDHGLVIRIDQLIARINQEPDWDWTLAEE